MVAVERNPLTLLTGRETEEAWQFEAATDARLLQQGLADAGFPSASIDEVTSRVFPQQVGGRNDHEDGLVACEMPPFRKLRDALFFRKIQVRERLEQRIELPLFLLAAPEAPDSEVEYEVGHAASFDAGWTVTVFGTGTGNSRSVQLTASGKFRTGAGQRQLVFLPVNVVAEAVDVVEFGEKVGEGVRTSAAFAQGAIRQSEAVRTLLSDPEGPWMVIDREAFELQNAMSVKCDYQRTMTAGVNGDLEIGITAFGVKISVKASAKRQKSYSLRYSLPPGHVYQCERISGPHIADGLRWSVT
jgi:hypothetical protein